MQPKRYRKCTPAGALGDEAQLSAGQRCGSEFDIMNGKPMETIDVFFGAPSVVKDVDAFLIFTQDSR